MRIRFEDSDFYCYLHSPNSEGLYRHIITNGKISDFISEIKNDYDDIEIPEDSPFLGLFYHDNHKIYGPGQFIELDLVSGNINYSELQSEFDNDPNLIELYNGREDRANEWNYPTRKVNTLILFMDWHYRYRILAPLNYEPTI